MSIALRFLLAANYMHMFGWGLFAPLYAIFVLNIGGSAFQATLAWAAYGLLGGFLMILFGYIENSRRNTRSMISAGYFIITLAWLSYLFVDTMNEFMVAQIFLAIGVGVLTPALRTVFAAYADKGKETQEYGLLDGGNYILLALSAAGGGALYHYISFDALILTMASFEALAGVSAYMLWRSTKPRHYYRRRSTKKRLRQLTAARGMSN